MTTPPSPLVPPSPTCESPPESFAPFVVDAPSFELHATKPTATANESVRARRPDARLDKLEKTTNRLYFNPNRFVTVSPDLMVIVVCCLIP